jgi:hypothetical protein
MTMAQSPLELDERVGTTHVIEKRGLIGTHPAAVVSLPSGSRRAAWVEPKDGLWWITPISSRSVCVNGEWIRHPRVLNDGDVLDLPDLFDVSVRHGLEPVPALDLQTPPKVRRRFARRVVLFERERALAWAEDRGCFVEMQRVLAMRAANLRSRPDDEQRVRWWRIPAIALPTSGRIFVERTYVGGASLRLLLSRVRQLRGELDDDVRRELLSAAANAMREENTALVGGAVRDLDLLVTWSGDVWVGDAGLESASSAPDWRRPLVTLADALGADLEFLGGDLLDTCRNLEGAPRGAAAEFASSVLPAWRDHQVAWLDEARMVVDAL